MKPKEDARVSKSKNALIDSFFSLLRNKSFDSITINEICDNANVTRATFYKHFNDKMSFLAIYFSRMKEKFDDLLAEADLLTGDERMEKLHEAENYLVGEMAYTCPLFGYKTLCLGVAGLEGAVSSPQGNHTFWYVKVPV